MGIEWLYLVANVNIDFFALENRLEKREVVVGDQFKECFLM